MHRHLGKALKLQVGRSRSCLLFLDVEQEALLFEPGGECVCQLVELLVDLSHSKESSRSA